jgi:hypothetical protein
MLKLGVAASAKYSNPSLVGYALRRLLSSNANFPLSADALRRLYPKHSLVMTTDFRLNPLNFPGARAIPLEEVPLVTNLVFAPLARSLGPLPGVLIDQVEFGAFRLAWDVSQACIILSYSKHRWGGIDV